MKKYWFLIVISIVMIASIGTFYIQSVLAGSNMPEFTIENKSGDEKEIASLLMTGNYYDELTYIGEDFEMTLDGVKYWQEKSLFERVEGFYSSARVKKLKKEHRNFMRGKYSGENLYFENEDFLAYADISYKNPYTTSSNEFQFSIAVLNKKTNKTVSFDHLVPNGGNFRYLDVIKTQVIDDQLKVITLNEHREGNDVDVHLYTFDLEGETLVDDEVVLISEGLEDRYIDISVLEIGDRAKESEYMGFVKRTIESKEVEEDNFTEITEEVVSEELIIYDLPSNTSKVIKLENLTELGFPEYLEGTNIYFTEINEDGVLKINVYDIESEQIINRIDVKLSNNSRGQIIKFNDGKLYNVGSYVDHETPALVTVVHLENGETLFVGEITPQDQDTKVGLNIYNILFE